jgi:segregation and condensation protein B
MRAVSDLRQVIEELKEEYAGQRRAFTVEETAGGFQLMTLPEFHPWVGKLREDEHETTLSQAALETLAIVAYKQPITRADIEDVRGVQSGYILRSLIERGLVRVTGRSDQLGHPLLYGTSKRFLDAFGLASLEALPTLDELEPSTGQ